MAQNSKMNPAFDMSDDDDMKDGQMYEQSTVIQQPLAAGRLKLYAFDPDSRQKIINLQTQHKKPKRVKAAVDERTQYVAQATDDNLAKLRQGMSYEEFLKGLIYGNEDHLLRGQFIKYLKVQFSYEEEDKEVQNKKSTMTSGRLFLTNHRLLFLSNEEFQMMFFSGVSKEKPEKQKKKDRKKEEKSAPSLLAVDRNDLSTMELKQVYMDLKQRKPYVIDPDVQKGKYYAVVGHASDAFQYFSIPLGCIKNVELDGDMNVTDISILKRRRPDCCFGICGCFGCDSCTKSWNEDWNAHQADNARVLSMGVKLPPWGHKCYVKIHVDNTQRLHDVRDFIGDLQHYAPDLYTGKMEYRG